MQSLGGIALRTVRSSQAIYLRSAVCYYSSSSDKSSYKCVVLGGGAGGCAMASKMARRFGAGHVAVVEPKDVCKCAGHTFMIVYSFT